MKADVDRRRVALVRGGEETGFRRTGSGYLVSARLVLTARHVIEDDQGVCWPRIDVRVGHPQDGTRRCAASACWTHPDGRDVALLLLDDCVEVPGTVRWGAPVGDEPLRYDALGFPSASATGGRHAVEHLRGELPLLGGGAGEKDRYVLDQGPAPGGPKAWRGASGSAVFCHDHLVGVVIHDDEAFENRRLHACPARSFAGDPGFGDLLERYGGERPRLSQVGTGLERYLRAARRASAEHPYPGIAPGTMPPLSHVYLRQEVVRQEVPAVPSPPRPAGDVLAGDGTCLVIAGPGGGKSSLLRTRLTHGVAQWLDGSDGTTPAPVLAPAAALLGMPLSRALVTTVHAQLRQYGLTRPLPDTFFEGRPGAGRRWLVLVDGLDEITDPDERKDVLKTVANAGDDYAFVVATRPLHETELGILGPEVPRYHLEPFAPDELEHVATGWFTALGVTEPENGARQFLTAIGRAQLTDLVRVPLTMSMLCQLWAREPGGPLPRGRGEIYGHFVESLQARQYHAHALEQARAAMRQYGSDAEAGAERAVLGLQNMLAAVAHHLLLAKRGDGDRTVLDLVLQHPGAGRPAAVPKKRWRDFLESALCGTGLLTRGSDDLVFTHQTFMEYFAARHVVGDEARLRVVFRKTFVRPARYLPGKDLSPGIRPRLPLSRYWKPPRYDPFDGFLLDLTPQGHPLKREFLSRMASARAGLDGYDYLGKLTRSGVFLPGDIIVSTVGLLRRLVSDQSLGGHHRVIAALVLTDFDQAAGIELTRGLAHDATLDGLSRTLAAEELARSGLGEAAPILRALAQDGTLDAYDRAAAIWTATRLDPAGDPRAALAMAAFDSAFALQHLNALGRDRAVPSHERLKAAEQLTELTPSEGAELLHFLAHDSTMADRERVSAAASLSDTNPSGAELLEKLALAPTTDSFSRLWAAKRLWQRDPQLARTALRALQQDTTVAPSIRYQASVLLARSRDSMPDR